MEETAIFITRIIGHAAEILSACIIGTALLKVVYDYLTTLIKKKESISKEMIRIRFGSSVAVSLELLLGADVLNTAVAPSWEDIGKLAAIAVLRTALNYFLERELTYSNEGK